MASINKNKVIWKKKDGIVTVLMLESGAFFEFNKVGSMVWQGIAEGLAADAIIEKMAEIFDVTREKLALDVHGFMVKMLSSDLIEDSTTTDQSR